MTMRSMRSGVRLLLGLSLIAGATSAALADSIAATRAVVSSNTINLNGINGDASYSISNANLAQFWSKLGGTVGNSYGPTGDGSGEFRTFCVDLYHTLSSNTMNFQHATVSTTSNPALPDLASPLHTRNMGKVGWLLQTYGAGVDTGTNWTGAGLMGLSIADRASALQAAIWIAGFGVDATTGWSTNNATITTAASTLLTALGSNTAAAGLIDYAPRPGYSGESPTSQDQAFAVPEPSTFAIAGLGALAFLGYGLRRRRAEGAAA